MLEISVMNSRSPILFSRHDLKFFPIRKGKKNGYGLVSHCDSFNTLFEIWTKKPAPPQFFGYFEEVCLLAQNNKIQHKTFFSLSIITYECVICIWQNIFFWNIIFLTPYFKSALVAMAMCSLIGVVTITCFFSDGC